MSSGGDTERVDRRVVVAEGPAQDLVRVLPQRGDRPDVLAGDPDTP